MRKILVFLFVLIMGATSVLGWTPQHDLSSVYSTSNEIQTAQHQRMRMEQMMWNNYAYDRMKPTYSIYERMIGWDTEYNPILFKHLTVFNYNYLIDGGD